MREYIAKSEADIKKAVDFIFRYYRGEIDLHYQRPALPLKNQLEKR